MPDGPDLRPLNAALFAGLSPADTWEQIRKLSQEALTPGDRWYIATCRYCGDEFWTEREPTGTKWTQMCTSCLEDQV